MPVARTVPCRRTPSWSIVPTIQYDFPSITAQVQFIQQEAHSIEVTHSVDITPAPPNDSPELRVAQCNAFRFLMLTRLLSLTK